MLAKLRARLTYANVVATLALFVALGGSSYAAIQVTGKNVKNSSLTGKDIKNNSLTGSDVKGVKSGDVSDGSLLAKDFKAGQLPAGAQGPKGDQGDSATKLFAFVTQTGNLVWGSGATGASRLGINPTGIYRVTFDRVLNHCVGVASPGVALPGPPSESTSTNTDPISTITGSGDGRSVDVQTGNPPRDDSFVLAVFC